MAKGKGRGVIYGQFRGRGSPTRCLGQCGRRIVYGDRCPNCQRKLRERKARKPR